MFIKDMSNADYHSHPAIGSSRLKLMSCPAKYRAWVPVASTAALRFGSVFHAWVEGRPIHITGLPISRRSKEGRAAWADFFAKHGASGGEITALPAADWESEFTAQTGRIIASPAEIQVANGMTESIARNPDAMAALTGGENEVSIFWTDRETGLALKCRPDHLNGLFCGELKSAADASERGFQNAIMRHGYHISAAMYLDGIKQATGDRLKHRFIACEKSAPYLCAVYDLSGSALEVGRLEYRRLLNLLAECEASNNWPGYANNPELDLPAWAYPDDVLTDEVIL